MTTPIGSPQLFVTDHAAKQLYALLMQENLTEGDGNPQVKFRVSIEGGGCSGFKYEFLIEESVGEGDYVFKKTVQIEGKQYEIQILVNPISFMYLQNAEIDYQEDFQQSGFKIHNPNAQTTCSCGSSFAA